MVKIILNIFYEPVDQLKRFICDNRDLYVPVNGGASLKNDEWCKKNLFFDDEGNDVISSLNGRLNEFTSIYWFWRNMQMFGNPDRIGFSHYRRFFDRKTVEESPADILVGKPVFPCGLTIARQYALYHKLDDLWKCAETIYSSDAGLGNSFASYVNSRCENFAPCNMFVMKRGLFEEWCGFAFPLMTRLVESIDVSGRDNYQKRAVCFLMERVFGWWCWEKKNAGAEVEETPIIERLEWKNNTLNERGTYERQ